MGGMLLRKYFCNFFLAFLLISPDYVYAAGKENSDNELLESSDATGISSLKGRKFRQAAISAMRSGRNSAMSEIVGSDTAILHAKAVYTGLLSPEDWALYGTAGD